MPWSGLSVPMEATVRGFGASEAIFRKHLTESIHRVAALGIKTSAPCRQ